MSATPSTDAIGLATERQTLASDPDISVWVAANAGSGKTHVLARRVIRLLLRGVAPSRILCLTYTKAAAANMANRVLGELRSWVSLPAADLDARIEAADGPMQGESAIRRRAHARRLFAAALETPGGLKIQTIHAFCSALLHRFPFEAGVPAGFGDLDEAARADLLRRVREEVVLEAAAAPSSERGRALAHLVAEVSDAGLTALLTGLIDHPETLAASPADIAMAVGAEPGADAREIERKIVDDGIFARGAWRGFAEALIQEGGNCARRGQALLEAASAPEAFVADAYARVFFKADGGPYGDSQFGAAKVRERYPQMLAERDRLIPLAARLTAARAAARSVAAILLAKEAFSRYEKAKRARGRLDFTDLITATRRLLDHENGSAWVHYKLDQGIDHVLVDEAQDTSPEQWDVIRPLVMEFFAGEGAQPRNRSLFVVGDEKQSIFSFQGADPRRFDAMRAEFSRRAGSVRFEQVRLQHSFRSAPGILEAVDTVFGREQAYSGLTAEPEATIHQPIHAALPALVDIWQVERPEEKVETDQWTRPLDAPDEDDPVSRLGEKIARHVKARIDARFPVSRRKDTRPIRPGDVLVLVRRRGGIFEAVIRSLKNLGVPVAGADRLKVAEHIAVMDLMALGDCLLSPDDELALASVLKSPLFGFSEKDLLDLAARRTRRLGEELRAQARSRPHWAEAAQMLDRLREEALTLRPFDFYTRVLTRERGRAKMLARLGPEAADALDEMLTLARSYEGIETPSLTGFLAFLRRGSTDAKRDMEAERDEVRVMTVHGAKGLEAPYVILADTTGMPRTGDDARLVRAATPDGRPLALFSPSKKTDTPVTAELRQRGEQAALDEYRRLLYVALTRAETTLVIAGAQGRTERRPDCWYDLVRTALEPEAVEMPAVGFAGTVLRWRGDGEPAPDALPPAKADPNAAAVFTEDDLLARLRMSPAEATPHPRIAPSALQAGSDNLSAERRREREEALRRGDLVHRLLAGLPGLPEAERAEAGRRLLDLHARDWTGEARDEVLRAALGTLALPDLAPLFAIDSHAEVPLMGVLDDGTTVNGRIDRIAIEPGRILLADFKTDARPPATPLAGHVHQITLYARLAERLFPGRAVDARIVYTAGPTIHRIEVQARR
ncbi:double-strand break repair helicase AddA [Ancylobacter sp. 6x-1]|uniref:DNA 3'-5' helicase n=1 Tax=Ancylobacter crimeensis TaxID=2579147 RepID=A0ABT0DBD3_9HYPH|nr:double-strand break repair helicase AddA [Ancylobacter crimeensis]MCK0197072.1 double-strand break repair helicase AddA [Ancylobacter crimeensis]